MNEIENYFSGLSRESLGVFITSSILIIFALYINFKVKRVDPLAKPKGIMILVELIVEGVTNLSIGLFGEDRKGIYSPLLLTLGTIIATNIMLGLLGLPVAVNNYWVCLALATTTFIWIQTTAIISKGPINYLLEFAIIFRVKKWPLIVNIIILGPFIIAINLLMLPFNMLGEFSLPISMSLRLFGNIVSGTLIIMMVYLGVGIIVDSLGPLGYAGLILASMLHLIFDVIFGAIQVYVFVLLTGVFVSQKLPE